VINEELTAGTEISRLCHRESGHEESEREFHQEGIAETWSQA
jgi:hypothetical protein